MVYGVGGYNNIGKNSVRFKVDKVSTEKIDDKENGILEFEKHP